MSGKKPPDESWRWRIMYQRLDLPPILRQMVKTHFSLNGEVSHGVVT